MGGLTAYVGVHALVVPPKQGDTVVVSAAGGAVGSFAAQLCKATGATVIGVAGGAEKCEFLRKDLGLDGAVDYKDKTTSIAAQLDKLCPDGVDFFFDNVGGEILDEVLNRVRMQGRIVICGGISKYNGSTASGPTNYLKLAERNAIMTGFVVSDFPAACATGMEMMRYLHHRGAVKTFETRKQGIEAYPRALNSLFAGGSLGKTMVELVPGHDVCCWQQDATAAPAALPTARL